MNVYSDLTQNLFLGLGILEEAVANLTNITTFHGDLLVDHETRLVVTEDMYPSRLYVKLNGILTVMCLD